MTAGAQAAEWVAALPVIGAAVLVFYGPGLLIGGLLRVRGPLLWAVAPAISSAAVSLVAIGLGVLGVRWLPWSAAVGILIVAALSWVASRLIAGRPSVDPAPRPRPGRLAIWALVLGSVLGAIRVGVMVGTPSSLSQTNDATFHLNALRFIEDTGSASSLTLSGTIDAHSFYPAAWHGITSLVQMVSGSGIAISANAVSLLIAGPVWAGSVVALVWVTTRHDRVATAAAGLFAPALFGFPFMMLDHGVLYPYALALALVLASTAITLDIVGGMRRRGAEGEPGARRIALAVVVLLASLAGVALAQPAAIQFWIISLVAIVGWELLSRWRVSDPRARWRLIAVGVVVVVFSAVVWYVLTKGTSGNLWRPRRSALDALWDIATNSALGAPASFTISVLAIVGFIRCVRVASYRWLPTVTLVLVWLAFVALAVNNGLVRLAFLGAWYGDPFRLTALVSLAVIPLAAIGFSWIVGAMAGARMPRLRALSTATGALLIVLVLVEMVVGTIVTRTSGRDDYTVAEDSYLSIDERELLTALPDLVAEDSRILGNPSTGAAFGYALSGLDVFPRTWAMPGDEQFKILRFELRDIATTPRVCDVVEDMDIDYVLDFGLGEEAPGRWVMPGMTGFDDVEGFELVKQIGDASLWRITACG